MKNNRTDTSTARKFGQRLKYLRQMKKMTQDHMAAELGMSKRQLRRIELGESTPQFSLMEKLCRILDINMLQLFMFQEEAEMPSHKSDVVRSTHSFDSKSIVDPPLVGVWSINRLTRDMQWTPSIYEFLEYSRFSVKPTLKRFLHRVHPHHKQELKSFVEAAFSPDYSGKLLIRITARKSVDRDILLINEPSCTQLDDHNEIRLTILDMTELLEIQNQLLLNKEQLEQTVAVRNQELARAVADTKQELKLRRKAEKKALENEAHFRFVAESSPVALVTLDKDMNIQYLSRKFVDLFGYDISDISCVEDWVIRAYPDPEFRKQVLEEWNAVLDRAIADKKGIKPLRYPVVCKDGSMRYIEFRTSSPGDVFVVAFVDITEQMMARQALQEREALKGLLMNLATELINIPLQKIDPAINIMLEKIGLFAGADRVYIFEHDYNRMTTSNTYEWCAPEITPQICNLQAIPFASHTQVLETHNKGCVVYVSDVSKMPEDNKLRLILEPQDIKSALLIPIMKQGINSGFVGFDAVKEKRTFSKDEIDLLRVFAEIIANIMCRRGSEQKLRIREMALYSTDDAVAIADMQGKIKFVNPAFLNLWGYDYDKDVLGRYAPGFHGNVEESEEIMHQVMKKGKIIQQDMTARRKDGTIIKVNVTSNLITNDSGKHLGMVGVFRIA